METSIAQTSAHGATIASSNAIRVLLVAGHGLMRAGLERLVAGLPGAELVGVVDNGGDAAGIEARNEPDVVVLDLGTLGADPVTHIRELRRLRPGARILALSTTGDVDSMIEAIDAGAVAAVVLDADADDLRRAIHDVSLGSSSVDPQVARQRLASPPRAFPTRRLSNREREILSLLAGGLSNRRIANDLGISEPTVRSHLTRIYRRLRVDDRTQAALWAVRHGIRAERPVTVWMT